MSPDEVLALGLGALIGASAVGFAWLVYLWRTRADRIRITEPEPEIWP